MIRAPFDEGPMLACGWPWHGPVRRASGGGSGGGMPWEIQLPNGSVYSFSSNQFVQSQVSHLFDMGLPDVPDAELEAAGGAWWGRALLRSEIPSPVDTNATQTDDLPRLWYGRGLLNADGNLGYIIGAPLVIQPTDPELPAFRVFCRVSLRGNTLRVSVRHNGATINVVRPLTLAQQGQGAGQPIALAYGVTNIPTSGYRAAEINGTSPGFYRGWVRDFTQNRVLLGVMAYPDTNAPAGVSLLSTASTRVAASWPWNFFPLFGLLEVEILPSMFEGGSADDAVVVRLIEDRAAAMGNPVYEFEDYPLPGSGRQYLARWTQTGALLNAFYDRAGALKTVRMNRVQQSTLHRRTINDDFTSYQQQDTGRSTTFDLVGVTGSVVDTFTIAEQLTEIQRGSSLQVIRSVTATGEPDDIVDSGLVTGTVTWAAPLPVAMPGAHFWVPVLAQIYNVLGSPIIPPQDIRVAWCLPYGNRMGGIVHTRELYDTTLPATVNIKHRPLAGPTGTVGGHVSAARVRESEQNIRSLWFFDAEPRAAFNPATDEFARGTVTWV